MCLHRVCKATALALASTLFLNAATYEVAQNHPKANDNGPGSPEQPWKTISAAAARVSAGDRILIRGDTYRERVLVQASGTPEAPIRLEAAPGDTSF